MTPKTEKCPQCESDEKNVLGKECRFRSSDPIHFKRAHEWHSTPPLPSQVQKSVGTEKAAPSKGECSLHSRQTSDSPLPEQESLAELEKEWLAQSEISSYQNWLHAKYFGLQDELKRMREATIHTIVVEPRIPVDGYWVARCIEKRWVTTGKGKEEAIALMREIIDRETGAASQKGRG